MSKLLSSLSILAFPATFGFGCWREKLGFIIKGLCLVKPVPILGLIALIGGCAVVMPTIRAGYRETLTPKDILDASVLALQEYDFTVSTVNTELGLLVTDWRAATTPEEEAATACLNTLFLSPLHPGFGDSGRQRIRLSLTVDQRAQTITIKPHKQGSTNVRGWFEVNLDNGDRTMLQALVSDIVARIGGSPDDIEWEELSEGAIIEDHND